jgi:hypothetical protein
MDGSQSALRRAAAEAFSHSLDQLGVWFEPEAEANLAAQPVKAQPEMHSVIGATSPKTATLKALEEAAADIEQLFGQRK